MTLSKLQKLKDKLFKPKFLNNKKKILKVKKYVESFPEPKNLFERSFFQYKAARYKTETLIAKTSYYFGARLCLTKFVKSALKASVENNDGIKAVKDKPIALFWNSLGEKIIPDELKEKYLIVKIEEPCESLLLSRDTEFIGKNLRSYEKNKYFYFKIVARIAIYRYLIEKYRPSAIICTCEYSFTSSALTAFLEENNVKHINIMHGEKLYDGVNSFFAFDECYVWDKHYEKLFLSLRAKQGQFKVSVPQSLKIADGTDKNCDYKFYLDIETKKKLKILKKAVSKLILSGNRVVIRPHPIYTDKKLLKKYFPEEITEDPLVKDIQSSIAESKNVVARFSTVLNQAYNAGIKIVLDDVSNNKYYKLLSDLNYIMMGKEHGILSDLIAE